MKKTIIPHIPFYFIRHGQTDWNLKNMIQGHIDIPLNETGIHQAAAAGTLLANKGITKIISSPLVRAYKTAEVINEVLQVPLDMHDGLKERHLGALEGTVKTESTFTNADHNYTQTAEGCEHIDVFKKRIADALHELLDPDQNTLIVAHGGVYWALMSMLGFENQASSNAVPHYIRPVPFKPAENANDQEWLVCPVQELAVTEL